MEGGDVFGFSARCTCALTITLTTARAQICDFGSAFHLREMSELKDTPLLVTYTYCTHDTRPCLHRGSTRASCMLALVMS